MASPRPRIYVGDELIPHFVRTYGDARPGTLAALISSGDTLEIAVPHGSAAARLKATPGTRVFVTAGQ